jgi:putative aminopeptidase FrvX
LCPGFIDYLENGVLMIKRITVFILSLTALFCFSPLCGEDTPVLKLTRTLFSIPSPTGYEEPLADAIIKILPEGQRIRRDNLGSLYCEPGNQVSQLAVCTPMDETGYFVSGIDPGGYLRLDRAVYVPSLIDSYHLGHPMIVWTGGGPIEGVLALPSLHILSSEVRKEFQEKPGLHLAFLDIGVETEKGARERGVKMMDAVTPWREITELADDQMAGYGLGLKSCAALVLDLAKNFAKPRSPDTSFVWMAQTKFPVRRSRPRAALGSLRVAQEIKARGIVVVDVFPCGSESHKDVMLGKGPVLVYSGDRETKTGDNVRSLCRAKGLPLQLAPDFTSSVLNPFTAEEKDFVGLFLPVKFAQTPSEIVHFKDLETLHVLLAALLKEGRI